MRFQPECYPCALRMVRSTAEIMKLPADVTEKALARARELLDTIDTSWSPPRIVPAVFRAFREVAGIPDGRRFDPYAEVKRDINDRVSRCFDRLADLVRAAPSPMHAALRIAAAGNIIDVGIHNHADIDVEQEIDLIEHLDFAVFEAEELIGRLQTARSLLYIADNAGETFFDRILLTEIRAMRPRLDIVYAVRSKPVLNDATAEDALTAGIDELAGIIASGSASPGTILEDATEEFISIFRDADVIISKGQGNYETLHDRDNLNIFYILRVKCACVARETGHPLGSLLLMREQPGHRDANQPDGKVR